MNIAFNHTIVHASDRAAEATFFTEIFGLPAATPLGHFLVAEIDHDASIDFMQADGDIGGQHYAFLVGDDDFTAIYGRLVEREIDHWADPSAQMPRQINHRDGGRGVYFRSPSGHYLEIITRPYGAPADWTPAST